MTLCVPMNVATYAPMSYVPDQIQWVQPYKFTGGPTHVLAAAYSLS